MGDVSTEGTDDSSSPERPKKKVKLTKQEKKLLMLKKIEEENKNDIRAILKLELRLCQKNKKSVFEQWRETCKDIKYKELEIELNSWADRAECIFNHTEDIIKRLLEHIDGNRIYQAQNFGVLANLIEYITETYNSLRNNSKLSYESKSIEILENFYKECNIDESNCDQFENTCYVSNLMHERQRKEDEQYFIQRECNVVTEEIHRRYQIRDDVFIKMNSLYKQVKSFLDYLRFAFSAERVKLLVQLEKTNEQHTVDQRKGDEAYYAAEKEVISLHRKLYDMETSFILRERVLKVERNKLRQRTTELRNQTKHEHKFTKELLGLIASESFNAKKRLKENEKLGEHILTLLSICNKHQTQNEKIVPSFLPRSNQTLEHISVRALNLQKHLDRPDCVIADQMYLMSDFWKRLAIVDMQTERLEEHKRQLMAENLKYRDDVRKVFCSNTSAITSNSMENFGNLASAIVYESIENLDISVNNDER